MAERYLEQIRAIIRVCEDTDGILIVDKNGIIRDHRIAMNYYWKEEETVGHHIRELYPGLDEDSSTILRALRTGQAIYDQRQELVTSRGEQVELDATTIPIVVNGEVEGAVDCARFYVVGQRIVRGGRRGGLSTLGRIVTQSPKMEDLKRRIRSAAQLDSPVLIYGETGTGKELVAEALHSEGPRGGEPFVAQNCAAIPSNLLESLFFGTEKGSYTGALTRKGLFEEATGGTLFLDEINSMDIGLQAKLLKALEEKKARRLGGSRDTPFDVRIVAAVKEPPEELLRSGKLREDLYYRLGVVRLNLPPLRERPEDIPLLTNYFIEQYNRSMKRNIRGVSPVQHPRHGGSTELVLAGYAGPAHRPGGGAVPPVPLAGQHPPAAQRGGGRLCHRPGRAADCGGSGGEAGRRDGTADPPGGPGTAAGGGDLPQPGGGAV